jgi:fibronectin-binding autotransporter adhesin
MGSSTATNIGSLTMSGGSLTTTSSDIRIGGNSLTTGGTGTFTQSGGTVLMNAGNLNIGQGSAGAVGTYNMSGGALVINSNNIMAVGNRGTGTVNQTGGSIYVRGAGAGTGTAVVQLGRNVAAGTGNGTYLLSGGTLTAFNTQFGNAAGIAGSTNTFTLSGTGKLITNNISILNTAATNTFNFIGGTLNANNVSIPLVNNGGTLAPGLINFAVSDTNGATLNAIGTTFFTGNNNYTQNATGIYAVDIASLGSNDLIDAGAGTNTGSITLAGSINVNLLSAFDPAIGSTFDIATADTLNSLAVVNGTTPGGNLFQQSIVTGGDGRQVLRLTVVAAPEPGTMAALGLSSLAFMLRRRSKG